MTETKPHHGRNIKRFREWVGVKQETLASELNWSQQKVSLLEQKEDIEDDVLAQVAKILNVSSDVLKNYNGEQPIFNIQNNYEGSNANATNINTNNNNCVVNYATEWLEALNEVKRLNEENKSLYERMLNDKDVMIEGLKKILNK